MASASTQWNLTVDAGIDSEVREFLGLTGEEADAQLSKFVEDAVKARIFELAAEQAKAANACYSAEEIQHAVDEALDWARSR